MLIAFSGVTSIAIAQLKGSNHKYRKLVLRARRFPGERLLFEALPEDQLEVYVTNFLTVALVEITTCDRLTIKAIQTEQPCIDQQRDFSVSVL